MAAPERVFLRACAASGPGDWHGWNRELLALDPGDWRAIHDWSVEHGFVGLLARSLAWAADETGVRPPILEALAAGRRKQLVQQLSRKRAARAVAEAYEAKGIPFIVFKGIVLAEEIYGDLSLRAFRDLDIMVPRDRLDEAYDAALALGYRLAYLDHVREYVQAGAHAAGLVHDDGSSLDLHWSIAPEMSEDQVAALWRDCAPAPAGASMPGLRLSPAATLVHLAKHFHTHQYCALSSVDFHVAARAFAARIAPGELDRIAQELATTPAVDVAFSLCARAFGVDRRPQLRASAPGIAPRLAQHVLTDNFLVRAAQHSRIGNWSRYLVTSGSLGSTVRSLSEILVPDKLVLSRFFNRPFESRMYLQYYRRQLVKVFTLSAR